MNAPWWQTAVVYQIYPRSFLDAGGDGVGDLEGVRRGLDHLAWLGVDAVWLSPFYRSPMADFGYDVADHCDVDPLFGTLADFDRLLADAHDRGIRVLVDLVPNHTSDRHPWFVESRASRTSPKRDWYVWRGGDPATPPNNWRAAFVGGPAWTWDDATGQWYLHLFLPQQPDLNWAHPEVHDAMHGVMRFWLDRGVDGFRIDVVQALGKHEALPDDPAGISHVPHCAVHDDPATHPIVRGMRDVVDAYPGDRVLVGEVYLLDTRKVVTYFGEGNELHLAFNFPPLFARWSAAAWRGEVAVAEAEHNAVGAWPTWVLSNHDNPRHRSRYGGSEARARAAAVLLLTLRGTPFVYQGGSSGWRTPPCPPSGPSTPAAATGAGGRSPGTAPPPTAGRAAPMRGCPGRPRPAAATWPPSGRTSARSSTSTAGCWPPAAPRPPCSSARGPSGPAAPTTSSCSSASTATTDASCW